MSDDGYRVSDGGRVFRAWGDRAMDLDWRTGVFRHLSSVGLSSEGLSSEGLAATYSPTRSRAVPSALRVFTAEFGMGSGVGPLAMATKPSEDRNQKTGIRDQIPALGLEVASFAFTPSDT